MRSFRHTWRCLSETGSLTSQGISYIKLCRQTVDVQLMKYYITPNFTHIFTPSAMLPSNNKLPALSPWSKVSSCHPDMNSHLARLPPFSSYNISGVLLELQKQLHQCFSSLRMLDTFFCHSLRHLNSTKIYSHLST